MKKLLTAIALIACFVLPLSAMAMTTIADNDLSTVTGQAGVSIGADVTMNLSSDIIAWGDSDGIVTAANAGWVGLASLTIDDIHIRLRNDILFANQLLTIDVYTLSNVTAVRIGLPTFEISMATLDAKVGLWSGSATTPTASTFQEMGTIYIGGMDVLMATNNYVDISKNETGSGVKIVLNNTVALAVIYSIPYTSTPYLGVTLMVLMEALIQQQTQVMSVLQMWMC